MKSITLLLMLMFTLVSCGGGGGGGSDKQDAIVAPQVPEETDPGTDTGTDPDTNTGLPNSAYTFDSNIKWISLTNAQKNKFLNAVDMIKRVVASEEFRDAILNHKYNGRKTFVDNNGLTNSQIYNKILEAAEKLYPSKNNKMDMEVTTYYSDNNVVGYTYATSKRIWVNRKFFDTYGTSSVAANLFHEWLHKVGFGHAATYSTSRDYSVPYAIGSLIRRLGPKV